MIALGIDPSVANRPCAFAVLSLSSAFDRPAYVTKGELAPTEAALLTLLAEHKVEVVGVEDPAGFVFSFARTKAVLETKGVAVQLATWAEARLPTVRMPAAKVRNGLMGRPKRGAHGDKAVAQWLRYFVADWPRQSSNHARDAAMVAFAAWRTVMCERRDARGRTA